MIDPEELYIALNEAAERHGFGNFLTDADFEALVRAVLELPVRTGRDRRASEPARGGRDFDDEDRAELADLLGADMVRKLLATGRPASHPVPSYALEESCRGCGGPAAHKVEETSGPANFHPLTAYLCCGCFGRVIGDCGNYPYLQDREKPDERA